MQLRTSIRSSKLSQAATHTSPTSPHEYSLCSYKRAGKKRRNSSGNNISLFPLVALSHRSPVLQRANPKCNPPSHKFPCDICWWSKYFRELKGERENFKMADRPRQCPLRPPTTNQSTLGYYQPFWCSGKRQIPRYLASILRQCLDLGQICGHSGKVCTKTYINENNMHKNAFHQEGNGFAKILSKIIYQSV